MVDFAGRVVTYFHENDHDDEDYNAHSGNDGEFCGSALKRKRRMVIRKQG